MRGALFLEPMAPNDESVSNLSKILGLISIFAASLVAAYLPSASAKFSAFRLPGRTFFYARHFGTGVILSTSFTHLLSTAFEKLAHARWLGYKHWPGLFVMVSLMAIFLVEYVSNAYLVHHTKCDAENVTNAFTNGTKIQLPSGQVDEAGDEAIPLLASERSIARDKLILKRRERILGVLILQFGIMLHSFVIGLTMAVASAQRFGELVPAIFFHQVFEGIALGVRLAGLTKPPEDKSADSCPAETSSLHIQPAEPAFVPSRTERILPPLLSLLFALPIPLILFISLFIPALQATSSTLDGVFSLNDSAFLDTASNLQSRSEAMQGVTSAVSAGLLIYVSCVELLAADFLNNPEMQESLASVQMGALVAFAAGAAGMSAI